LKAHQLHRALQPPCSPEIAPADFSLFGYIKDKLKRLPFDSADSLYEAVREILDAITPETLISVFNDG
jgi:hypothetical protein